ncbi:MAG: UvrD-helicase domain-containing protein [Proteobacteria bacterium]|uniref:DNA 3'-5' helicase n=1 Tax=Candidatus Avisuccinivibrio stercorigallinarum TaxID=2840704 RepID=A0A9D9GV44_9GAMM|nr:UvrD-helicase domain-containing protein [Candidatus Avisuccinivibrio stercorigallinarum]
MLTEEQQAVLAAAQGLKPGQVLKIEACAGAGKTATLVEIAKSMPTARFLYLAFNKNIVEEARQRFTPNVRIFTTHALAYAWFAYTRGYEALRDIRSALRIFDLEPLFPKASHTELYGLLSGLKSFCYSAAKEPVNKDLMIIFKAAMEGKIPLTHDIYLKAYQLYCQPKFRNYDYVLLDEGQDTNDVTMELFLDNNCRRILVGDSHQAIYAFRGAVNALSRIKADQTLHLTNSFRCSQEILDRANWFLKRYADDRTSLKKMISCAPEREIAQKHSKSFITRTNAELIRRISEIQPADAGDFELLRQPELIFATAVSLLAIKNGRKQNVHPSCKWLTRFDGICNIKDFAEDCADLELLQNIKLVEDFGSALPELFERAQKIGPGRSDNSNPFPLVLTTAHSAKGLEWDEVDLAGDFAALCDLYDVIGQQVGKRKYTIEDFEQELNLYYVAVTRARLMLHDHTYNLVEYANAGQCPYDDEVQKLEDQLEEERRMPHETVRRGKNKSAKKKSSGSRKTSPRGRGSFF